MTDRDSKPVLSFTIPKWVPPIVIFVAMTALVTVLNAGTRVWRRMRATL